MDVNALDLFAADGDGSTAVQELATENMKRVVRPSSPASDGDDAWLADSAQSPDLIGNFVEIKTVWHPIGS
jgi:hypothetical protein